MVVAAVFGVPAPEAEAANVLPCEPEGPAPAPACDDAANDEEAAVLDGSPPDRLKLGRERMRFDFCADESKTGASLVRSVSVPPTKRREVFKSLAVALFHVCLW